MLPYRLDGGPVGPSSALRSRRRGRTTFVLLLLAALALPACGGPTTGDDRGSADPATAPRPEPLGPAEAEVAIRGCLQRFPETLAAHFAESEPLGVSVGRALQSPQKLDLVEVDLLRAAYVDGGDPARFVSGAGLTEAGRAVIDAAERADAHALDPASFGPARADPLLARVRAARTTLDATVVAAPSAGEVPRLVQAWEAAGVKATAAQACRQLFGLLQAPTGPSPATASALAARQVRHGELQAAVAAAELTVADVFLRYARALRHGNQRRPLWEQQRAAQRYKRARRRARRKSRERKAEDPPVPVPEPPPEPRSAEELSRAGLLRDLRRIEDGASASVVLKELPPRWEQYDKLVAELARYRAIAAAGGWEEIKRPRRAPGRGSPKHLIKALQRRLAAEGYFAGAADGRYSEELRLAVRAYQRTHQIMEQDEPTKAFWASLNVPVRARVERIELTLQRWRESLIGDDKTYVFVNIADFAAEVWSDGRRIFRTGVVVGNRDKRCDEESKREVYGFATPTMSAYITYLVFAPHWLVPARIKKEELDVERAKDPLYYEKTGYDLVNPGTPRERVRQLPGPTNSLGFVKVIFPNEHSVFLHDTPAKGLFQYPVRTFSHGCMRMQEPVEMARTLLTLDGQWSAEKYAKLKEQWDEIDFKPLQAAFDRETYETLRRTAAELEESVVLRTPIPVHVEYYTVRVGEDGRAQFLADPYRYDERRLRPRREKECTPDSAVAQEGFADMIKALDRTEGKLARLAQQARPLIAAGRAVDPKDGRRAERTQKRAVGLEEMLAQAATLGGRVRELHATLVEDLAAAEDEWDRSRTARALKLKRMLDELGRMRKRTVKSIERLRGNLESVGVDPDALPAAPAAPAEGASPAPSSTPPAAPQAAPGSGAAQPAPSDTESAP